MASVSWVTYTGKFEASNHTSALQAFQDTSLCLSPNNIHTTQESTTYTDVEESISLHEYLQRHEARVVLERGGRSSSCEEISDSEVEEALSGSACEEDN